MEEHVREKRMKDLKDAGFELHFHFNKRHNEHVLVAIGDGQDRWYFGPSEDSVLTQAWGDLQGDV